MLNKESLFRAILRSGNLAFEVDLVRAILKEQSSESLITEFTYWLDNKIINDVTPSISEYKYHSVLYAVVNQDWKLKPFYDADESFFKSFKTKVNDLAYHFAKEVSRISNLMVYKSVGYSKLTYVKDEHHYPSSITFQAELFKLEIPESIRNLDSKYRDAGNPPFLIPLDQIVGYFTAERAIELAKKNCSHNPSSIAFAHSMKATFIQSLRIINSVTRGFDTVSEEFDGSGNIHKTIVKINNDKRIPKSYKTISNFMELVSDAISDRLESCENELQLESFSNITGVRQPSNTCPMIDDKTKWVDTSDLEDEVDSLKDEISDIKSDIDSNEREMENPDYFEEDEDDESERIKSLSKENDKLSSQIDDLERKLRSKESEIEDRKEDVKAAAELLRDACDRTRKSISAYRKGLYAYYQTSLRVFRDNGKEYEVFHPNFECEGVEPRGWQEEGSFDRTLLDNNGYGDAVSNYDRIVDWGQSFENISPSDIGNLYDAPLFNDLVLTIVSQALEDELDEEVEEDRAS